MQNLTQYLKQFDHLAIALSGGVNSACLLRVAVEALGAARVAAFTVDTPCVPKRRIALAKKIAELAGVEHIVLQADTLDEQALNQAPLLRCASCRRKVLQAIQAEAWVRGFCAVAEGMHLEDLLAVRAQGEIAEALGVVSPFVACKMGAEAVASLHGGKTISPQSGCLLRCIEPGVRVTYDLLEQLERAQDALADMHIEADILLCKGGEAKVFSRVDERTLLRKQDDVARALAGLGFTVRFA